jgi:hypothetical protein
MRRQTTSAKLLHILPATPEAAARAARWNAVGEWVGCRRHLFELLVHAEPDAGLDDRPRQRGSQLHKVSIGGRRSLISSTVRLSTAREHPPPSTLGRISGSFRTEVCSDCASVIGAASISLLVSCSVGNGSHADCKCHQHVSHRQY